jgi:hypothetical protein
MSVKQHVDPRELNQLRQRIARLLDQGFIPMEVILSPESWERLKRQYRASVPGLPPKVISAREMLGVRNKLVPGTQGAIIRYFGGMDFPPDQAVEDGFIDLSKTSVGSQKSVDFGEGRCTPERVRAVRASDRRAQKGA